MARSDALIPLLKRAIKRGAEELKDQSDPWVPIWQSDLRKTGRTSEARQDRKTGNIRVTITWGGRVPGSGEVVKYARYQYFRSLRHFMPGGRPQPITNLPRPKGKSGKRNLYSRSYNQALRDGYLRRVPGGLVWDQRALRKPSVRREVRNAVIGGFNGTP